MTLYEKRIKEAQRLVSFSEEMIKVLESDRYQDDTKTYLMPDKVFLLGTIERDLKSAAESIRKVRFALLLGEDFE